MANKHIFLDRLLARRPGTAPIIGELKVSTPSAGDLLRGRKLEDIIEVYEATGVACLSVVTGRWFGGSLDLMPRVGAVTSLPILRKDFIATRSAIERSRTLG